MQSLKDVYQESWESIIKPYRVDYYDDNLGPTHRYWDTKLITREDFDCPTING